MIASEHQEQSAVVRWFRFQYPKLKLISIPNGSHLAGDIKQRAIKMRRMKEEGLEPGAYDLFLMAPNGKWAGLFIEMKSSSGRVSPEQKAFGEYAITMGYDARVCYGQDEAKLAIQDYLK